MASAGTVLFQRGQTYTDSENDLWDDTALIKAYDNAVSMVKAHIKKEKGLTDEDNAEVKGKKAKNRRKKKQKKKKQWKSGDQCRAVFSEDGLVYDAEIVSIDEEGGTCTVRYKGYGNEEEHILENLRPMPRVRNQKQTTQKTDTASLPDSMDFCDDKSHTSKDRQPHHISTAQNGTFPTLNGGFTYPGMPPFSLPSSMPFIPPSMLGSSIPSGMPFIPPPPPISAGNNVTDGESEAMCSMLMAWYMSGYHTGYYQGIKHARQKSGRLSPHTDSLR